MLTVPGVQGLRLWAIVQNDMRNAKNLITEKNT
jgi:hypothetical protein